MIPEITCFSKLEVGDIFKTYDGPKYVKTGGNIYAEVFTENDEQIMVKDGIVFPVVKFDHIDILFPPRYHFDGIKISFFMVPIGHYFTKNQVDYEVYQKISKDFYVNAFLNLVNWKGQPIEYKMWTLNIDVIYITEENQLEIIRQRTWRQKKQT